MAAPVPSSSITFAGKCSEIANPVTHSALDFFERPSVLIDYEGSFDQEFFPHVGCRGPQLDFFVTADSKNCIDLNRICPALEVTLCKPDGKDPADGSESIIVANNTLHSFLT